METLNSAKFTVFSVFSGLRPLTSALEDCIVECPRLCSGCGINTPKLAEGSLGFKNRNSLFLFAFAGQDLDNTILTKNDFFGNLLYVKNEASPMKTWKVHCHSMLVFLGSSVNVSHQCTSQWLTSLSW